MKKIYKFSLFILILLIGYSLGKINNMNDVYEEGKIQSPKKNTNMLSMMLETDAGSGNYEMTTRDTWPTSGYKFNSTLSKCENGGELSWDNENKRVLMSGNMSDKCYVYFDIAVLNLSLDNYIFNWESVDGASSYQIYSNGELLTTTNNTSAEIYGYYNEPGTYNINVKALDSANQVILDSNVIAYSLEKTTVELPSDFNKINSNYVMACGNHFDDCTSSNDGVYFYNSLIKTVTASQKNNILFENNNYKINIIDFNDYLNKTNNRWKRASAVGDIVIRYKVSLPVDYCFTSASCSNYALENMNIMVNGGKVYFSDNTFVVENVSSGDILYIWAFQLIEPGKIPADWKILGARFICLSSNTDVYVYDKKKKKFKKKKISEVDYDDEILCWDFDNGEFAIAKPIWIKKCEQTNKYNLLKFNDGSSLETINQHRIFNVEKGMFTYPMSDDTPIGTTTFNSKGEYVKLVSKEVIEKPIDYYNVMTEYHINLFANDILTSCRLSNMYKVKNMKYEYNKKRNNEYDLSKYDEKLVNGLRLREQDIEETKLKSYVDNMLRLMK